MISDNFYKVLGNKIRSRRQSLKMTQSALAEKINKSVPTISKYEKGEVEIGLDILIDICRILKLNIYTLIPSTEPQETDETQMTKHHDCFGDKVYLYCLA
ncbi:MAG TPA: helix-turn-helix transcriptional regulator [Mogibacterium sp.]|nr:helix-turn-helix transcriptional regulator [Mogibacterium sp.]